MMSELYGRIYLLSRSVSRRYLKVSSFMELKYEFGRKTIPVVG